MKEFIAVISFVVSVFSAALHTPFGEQSWSEHDVGLVAGQDWSLQM